MGFWKCNDGTEVEMVFDEQGNFVRFGDNVKTEDAEKANKEIVLAQKNIGMPRQERINKIDKMIDNGIPVEETAEKYSEDFCLTDCGMEMPSTCGENSDCNDCWIKSLEKKLGE